MEVLIQLVSSAVLVEFYSLVSIGWNSCSIVYENPGSPGELMTDHLLGESEKLKHLERLLVDSSKWTSNPQPASVLRGNQAKSSRFRVWLVLVSYLWV